MTAPALQSFRVRPTALWRQVFPIGIVLTAVLRVSSWLSGQPFSWPSTLPLAVAAGFIVVLFYFLRPVQAGPQGLVLLNRLGRRRLVPWDDVRDVSFCHRQPLQPAFRVADTQGGVHWIPRHTKDLHALQRLAVLHGGPLHPLAVMLATPLCDLP